jgi:tetraacyldisaccharide 4'-kinase
MLLATPRFWYCRRPTPLAHLLQPLAWLYALGVRRYRRRSCPVRLPVAVLSVGNITLGGTGKTPLVIALAQELRQRGRSVAVLLRGYGGGSRRPRRVSSADAAAQVGDEALEIQRSLPGVAVWVGSDRVAGGLAAIAAGADLLLLDDGLQHWRLARDCDISVLDDRHGVGNGLVFPAGPLREPADQLGRADLLVLTGSGDRAGPAGGAEARGCGAASGLAVPPPLWPAAKPWFRLAGWIEPPARLIGVPLLAFCGIGLPAKFFAALRQAGLELAATVGFADHHPYAASDLERLQRRADIHGATLVTTVKDWQRLPQGWRERVVALPLVLDSRMVEAIASAALARIGPRRLEIPE